MNGRVPCDHGRNAELQDWETQMESWAGGMRPDEMPTISSKVLDITR